MMPMPILPLPFATRTTCRACDGALDPVLSLGTLALPAFPLPTDLASVPRAPLDLQQCRTCGLAQLAHTVTPDLLYRQYWYRSGINETMRAELADVVRAAHDRVALTARSVVIDIGANDGTLLREYVTLPETPIRIAYEPATNLWESLRAWTNVLCDYFPDGHGTAGCASVITSIACFYDVESPQAFVKEVDRLLAPDGLWIVQFQDLAGMVRTTAFDNLCHEHLTYWSLDAFEQLLARTAVDLEVVEVERRAINGGSLRLYVQRKHPSWRHSTTDSVGMARAAEQPWIDWQALERFAWQVEQTRQQITTVVGALAQAELTVDLYAASTKGNTLLQVCGLGPEALRQAWERSPEKVGRVTATGIPIVSEEAGRQDPPDCLLIGAHQFRDAFVERERAYLEAGGTMLVPLPTVDLISSGLKGRVVAGVAG